MTLMAVCLCPGVLLAQDDSETSAEVEVEVEVEDREDRLTEARALYRAGETAFQHGRFANALRHFQSSYSLTPVPEMLYNIGNTADRLQQDEIAIDAFQRFVAQTEPSALRRQVESRLIALGSGATTAPDPNSPPTSETEPNSALSVEDPQAEITDSEPERDVVTILPSLAEGGSSAWLGLSLGGLAVALAGGVLMVTAGVDASAVESAPPDAYESVRTQHERGPTLFVTGLIVLGVGMLASAAGLIWRLTASEDVYVELSPVGFRGRY